MIRSQAHNTVHLYFEGFVDFHNLKDLSLASCHSVLLLLFVTGVMHEADNACSIRSTWLCCRQVQVLTAAHSGKHYMLDLTLTNSLLSFFFHLDLSF